MMTVTDELQQYRPLTFSEVFGFFVRILYPFLLLLITAVAVYASGYCSKHHLRTYPSAFIVVAACSLTMTIHGFSKMPRLLRSIKDMVLRWDGYHMLYFVDPTAFRVTVHGPLTVAAQNAMLKERTKESGIFFLVPINDKHKGFVFLGENTEDKATIQSELCWWGVKPVALSTEESSTKMTLIQLVDRDGNDSFPMSPCLAAAFLRSAHIGELGARNTLQGALASVLKDRK
jgi:hypothetical protein